MENNYSRRWMWMVLTGCLLSWYPIDAQPFNRTPFNVGYYIRGVANVDQRDVDAALKIWSHEIGAMYEADIKKKPEMGSLKNDRVTIKYLLLVKADSEIKDLVHLKDKKCVMKKDNRLAMMYMNTVLLKAKLSDTDHFLAEIQQKSKANQAILAVFFGQADACVVSDIGFAMMSELNPQIGRKLKVLASSEELVDVVAFFREKFPVTFKERAIEGIIKGVKKSKRAAQLKLLLNTEGMEPVSEQQLHSIRTLVADYNRLKAKK